MRRLPARGRAPGVWSAPGMVTLAVLSFCGFAGYAALLPVAPLWVVRGGSDTAGAGLVNFVLLAATVATQFAVPGLIRRLGWGPALAGGLTLLGLPSLLHVLTSDLVTTLALSAVRGVGFGVLTVAASAAAVLLVEPARRGAAIGAYSLALALPNVLLMPTGGWVADTLGFGWVFAVGALPLLGVPAALALARHLPERATHAPGEDLAAAHPGEDGAAAHPGEDGAAAHPGEDGSTGLPGRGAAAPAPGRPTSLALLPPTAVLLSVTLAGGAIITFAPQLVQAPWLSAAGLLALGLTSTLTRWRIGAVADRVGGHRLLLPFLLLLVVSLLALAWLVRVPVAPGLAVWWVLACAAVGVSYGALQNLTMLLAFAAAGPRRVGAASAVWNAGYDTGTAVGSLLVGAMAVTTGFGRAMALTAALCLVTVPLAVRARR